MGEARPTGGSSVQGLELALALLRSTNSSTVTGADHTFAFSRPVTNLAFAITDIDGTGFNANTTQWCRASVSVSFSAQWGDSQRVVPDRHGDGDQPMASQAQLVTRCGRPAQDVERREPFTFTLPCP